MRRLFYILLLVFASSSGFAQDRCGDPLDPDFDPFCDPADAPVDSGIGLLIGAAAFYTVKKIREKKQKADQPAGLHS